MTDNLIEVVARAIKYGLSVTASPFGDPLVDHHEDAARAAIAAIEAAGFDLVLRQHRDMGPGFTHCEGPQCPCFAAPKVAP